VSINPSVAFATEKQDLVMMCSDSIVMSGSARTSRAASRVRGVAPRSRHLVARTTGMRDTIVTLWVRVSFRVGALTPEYALNDVYDG
jgi:hypothetical protein